MQSNFIKARIKRPFILTGLTLLFTELLLMTGFGLIVKLLVIIIPVIFVVACIKRAAIAKALLLITAAVTVAWLSFSCASIAYEKETANTGYRQNITGTVTEITREENGSISSAILSDCTVGGVEISSKILLYTNKSADFTVSDIITCTPFQLVSNQGDGIFAYHTMSDKIYLKAFSSESTEYVVNKTYKGLINAILNLRSLVSEKLSRSLDSISFSISDALITGNTDSLSGEFSVNLKKCGISHIFAVSGMHLSIWTGLFFIILKNKSRVSFIPNLLASAFVIFFIVFTGFSPSVMRSGIMLLFVFMGRILKRQSDTLNNLGLAGTILLTYNPFLAGNISFLLSFTATAAISVWNDYIFPEKKYPVGKHQKIRRLLQNQLASILTSVGVILTTLPLTSVFFGYVSLISPLASLVSTPVAQAIMISSFIQVLIPEASRLFSCVSTITELFCDALTRIISFFARADFTVISTKPSTIIPVFIITFTVCAAIIIFIRKRRQALIAVLCGTLVLSSVICADIYIHRNETTVFVAGEENSTLISVIAPSGSHTTVYGSGGSYSQAYKLKSYLNSKGILSADLLFIPRDSKTENNNTAYIEENLLPQSRIIAPYGVYEKQINSDTYIYNENTEDFAASVIITGGIKLVICTLPSSDFSEKDDIFTSGDILICRSNIPKSLSTDNFSDIIIMTDKLRPLDISHISTKNKDTEIIIKGASYAIN